VATQSDSRVRNECFLPLSTPNTTARQGASKSIEGGRYIAVRSCKLNHLPTPSTRAKSYQQGFTLVELVVTLALAAILTTLAIPSFSEVLRQWRRDSATRELTTSLQLARSESIKSSRQIVVCPSTDGASCADCTEWNTGWIVFVDDSTSPPNGAYDANERILKVVTAPSGIESIESSDEVESMQFLPNGLMGSATTTLTITPSGATSDTKVDEITVSRVGRVSVVTKLP
jgi:type IV fimbrial biogenesis protein FimT